MEYYNRIHCKYTGIKGILKLYNDAIRYRYMITEKAKYKAKVLILWEKHGIQAAIDAFGVGRSTLYDWKDKWEKGGKTLEALNEKSKAPKERRKRIWGDKIIQEIKRIREAYPNLGEEKVYPLLEIFCNQNNLKCPKPATIGRLIKDLGGLRTYPKKLSHFGKVKKINRQKVLRKPKDFKVLYPGHQVAFDTIEKIVHGQRKYIITFEDIYARFAFAWATTSHASQAAKEFFDLCRKVFPIPFEFVLTDNGSEFKKHFSDEIKRLHLVHYHTYPKTPKMNAHIERFNRSIQEEFIDYNLFLLLDLDKFNNKLIEYLFFYNSQRVHYAFKNKLSPLQYMLSLKNTNKITLESGIGCGYTLITKLFLFPV